MFPARLILCPPLCGVMFLKAYRSGIIFLLLLALFSCDKENEPAIAPVINLVNDPGCITEGAVVVPGTRMTFKVEMEMGSEKLTNYYLELVSAGQPAIRYFDTAMYVEQLSWTGHFYKSPDSLETWTFVVRDRQGGRNSLALNIKADTGWVYGPILSLNSIELGAQNNSLHGGFYSLSQHEVYNLEQANENQPLIDLVFYYGEDALTMASPGANFESGIFPEELSPVNWEVRNTTRYIPTDLNSEDFEQITNDSLLVALYVEADGKRKAKTLVDGDIYLFMEQQNSLGIFRVNSASGTQEGIINLDIKIQTQGK